MQGPCLEFTTSLAAAREHFVPARRHRHELFCGAAPQFAIPRDTDLKTLPLNYYVKLLTDKRRPIRLAEHGDIQAF